LQAEPFEGRENVVRGAGLLARRIEVLDAHQPCAMAAPRLEVTGRSGDQ
jgi:hypothetical protein